MGYPKKATRILPPTLLSGAEIAGPLGVSEETVRRWRLRGKIKFVQYSKTLIRYPVSELERLLREGDA